eukprot:TRINITY_DN12123_c0_g1_i1.p1 TRINITY_DN12123_c0_g1~~TRINITY_DN12123_c0_g1_i1.p1  ORF type:complete len:266 (-),score=27.84 TRINITY_DN12123_c0_g1_i1:52-849(-)
MSAYYTLLRREQHLSGSVTAHYRSNIHAQGAWNPHEQHMAPATGIICSELAQFLPRENMRMGRVALDIFGLIGFGEFSITTRMIRAGKTIELVESEMQVNGKTCVSARAWKMMTQDTSMIAGLEDNRVTTPEALPVWQGMGCWPGGWIKSIETRSDERRPGKGLVWVKSKVDMVEDQETPDFIRLLGLVDGANGIVPRCDPREGWAFPNLDLQMHLYRQPQGQWLGLEATQQYGFDGIGLTSAILHDEVGPFGRSEQILTLRRRE